MSVDGDGWHFISHTITVGLLQTLSPLSSDMGEKAEELQQQRAL